MSMMLDIPNINDQLVQSLFPESSDCQFRLVEMLITLSVLTMLISDVTR